MDRYPRFIDELASFENQVALIWKGQEFTYKALSDEVVRRQKEFAWLEAGAVVGLEGDFSPTAIAILIALITKNAIIVPLDAKQRDKNSRKYEIAQIESLIGVRDNDTVDVVKSVRSTRSNHELYEVLRKREVPGLVLFTSGSSGEPKAAVHNFSKLLQKFNTRRKALRTINFLLFDHWGGLNTLFHILSNGGTVVTVDDRNPDHVLELIEKHQVELLPTTPSFLNLVILGRAYERWNLKSLKTISYGTEPMPANLLNHLNRLFPNVQLLQTYGLIELGVLRSKSENNESLWVKIGGEGYKTRVVDGILQIQSDSAMLGYLNAENPFTDDGWFITGDAVEVRGEFFKILGRKSEIINVGGEKVFPQEVENEMLGFDNIKEVMVYGEKHPITGNIVCARVVQQFEEEKKAYIGRLKAYCRTRLQSFKVPVKIQIEEGHLTTDRFKKKRYAGQPTE